MASIVTLERMKLNIELARKILTELRRELKLVREQYNVVVVNSLKEENAKLAAAVEHAKIRLIQIENQNGIKQIEGSTKSGAKQVSEQLNVKPESVQTLSGKSQTKNVKKPKDGKKSTASGDESLPIDVGRLDLRIGKIVDVKKHPHADTLYVLKIECGEEQPRTVCSGLVKHAFIEELQDRIVILLCNLKPVKMRGITSEAMVMCASTDSKIEVLIPPDGSQPGDLIDVEGYKRQPDSVMNPKKKIFETVAPDLHTNNNLEACYKNTPFQVVGKGYCVAKTLKNAAVK